MCLIDYFIFVVSQINYFLTQGTTSIEQIETSTLDDVAMANWIKANTDKKSVFINSPQDIFFYLNYERAMFVSWKHSPQSAKGMVEWYKRLKLVNGNREVNELSESWSNYASLNEENILQIRKEYSEVDYFIAPNSMDLNFPVSFQTAEHKLYDLRSY